MDVNFYGRCDECGLHCLVSGKERAKRSSTSPAPRPSTRCPRMGCTRPANSRLKVRPGPDTRLHCLSRPGLSESLAVELEPYNFRVLIVEPGAFRTNFLGAYKLNAAWSLEEVQGMAGQSAGRRGKGCCAYRRGGVLQRFGMRCVEGCEGQGCGLRLGPDCVERYEIKLEKFKMDLENGRQADLSTNVDE